MRISSLFLQGNQSHIDGSNTENNSAVPLQNLKNGMEEIASKQPGQSITGEVIEKNGNDILIAIGKNQMLRAKLDAGIPVEEGQMMTFAIKNAKGTKVILSPLFANTGNDPNVSKALQMAGIPENTVSSKMVQTMMQEGMSIDRDSLNRMMRTVNLYPEANVETVVQLSRLEIPITENSIIQMEAYKNYEHQITESLLALTDGLSDMVSEMAANGNVAEGIQLYREVFAILQEAVGGEVPETGSLMTGEELPVNGELPANGTLSANGEMTADAMLLTNKEAIPAENRAWQGEQMPAGELHPVRETVIREEVSAREADRTIDDIVKSFVSGDSTAKETLENLSRVLLEENGLTGHKESVAKLLSGKEFSQLLKNEIIKQWFLTPDEVADNKAEDMYERLNSQLNRLNQVVAQMDKGNTALARTISDLSGKIDFMNQLNQMFTYIQLPLKLQGNETNSELYVYTNKKNLAKKDGEVTALLHLDMEHLGSVDVHVAMKDNKVSTKFLLKDDSALDLVAENIDMLNERLNKRGYSLNASFVKKEEEESDNVMEEILKQDKNITASAGYSFDARA